MNLNIKTTPVITSLVEKLGETHLLKHPFYQAWSAGKLSVEDLKIYARQYFKHVDAFPRYLSTIHSKCTNLESRQVILENLIDEEKGPKNHPELWQQFAEGLGETRENVISQKSFPKTQELVNTFFKLSASSYAEGVGALFSHEQQVPEIAKSKIEGLEKYYGIKDERTIEFFKVHIVADEWHSEEAAHLIQNMNPSDQEKAKAAAIIAAQALWRFLDGVQERTVGTYK